MTYAELAKQRDDLKSENEMLRSIMDKMLEKGNRMEAENKKLLNSIEELTTKRCCLRCEIVKSLITKFTSQVKNAFYAEFDEVIPSIMASKIDAIAKEITGGA